MGDAVLLVGLDGRHLVVAGELEGLAVGAVHDVEQGVGAPLEPVGRAAARTGAAAPLVGEHDGRAVVVEVGRVPVGEVGIGDRVDADRVGRVGDVDQQPVALAGAGGEPDLGVRGDVVAGVGVGQGAVAHAGRVQLVLGAVAGVKGSPLDRRARQRVLQAVEHVALGEQAVLVDDRGVLRGVEGDLDDLDLPAVDVLVGHGLLSEGVVRAVESGLVRVAEAGGAVVVEEHPRRIVEVLDEPVRMGAAAGLDQADLLGARRVGDVEDADAAEAVLVRLGEGQRAFVTAVDAGPGCLDRDEQQVPHDRGVVLAAGAHDFDDDARVRRVGDVEDREAGEVALYGQVAGERQVGVGADDAAERGLEVSRIEEAALGLVEAADEVQPAAGRLGVLEAAVQPDAGVVGGGLARPRHVLGAGSGGKEGNDHEHCGEQDQGTSCGFGPPGGART